MLIVPSFSPRRTVATAQVLYHRFHLFFPVKDFNFQVDSPNLTEYRHLLMRPRTGCFDCGFTSRMQAGGHAQEAQRAADCCTSGEGCARGSKHFLRPRSSHPRAGAFAANSGRASYTRDHLLQLQSPLECSIPFPRIVFHCQPKPGCFRVCAEDWAASRWYVESLVHYARSDKLSSASKDYVKRAFRLAVDAHRTVLPLSYPPHAIAAACLYLTGFLTVSEMEGDSLYFPAGWVTELYCDMADIEGVCTCSWTEVES